MPVNLGTLQTAEIEATAAFLRGLLSVSTPIADRIAMVITMKTKTVEAPIASMIGPLREWVGPRLVEALQRDSHAITAKSFEKTVGIPREALEDDNTGSYMASIQTLGMRAKTFRDEQLCAKLELGETDLCYDGTAFFNATHPIEKNAANTFSNLTGSGQPAWYLFDTTKGVMPMVWGNRLDPEFATLWNVDDPNVFWLNEYISGVYARGVADYGFPQCAHKSKAVLDADTFDTAFTTMTRLENDKGENLQIRPNLIVVPSILEPDAEALFKIRTVATGGDNRHFGRVEVLVGQRLSNT